MHPMIRRILFTAWYIAATVGFVYYLFPSETVSKAAAHRFREAAPGWRVDLTGLTPAFPFAVRAEKTRFEYGPEAMLTIANGRVRPAILRLFGPDKRFFLSGSAHGGRVAATVDVGDAEREQRISAAGTFSDLRIGLLDPVAFRIPDRIDGRLYGKYTISAANGVVRDAEIDIDIRDFALLLGAGSPLGDRLAFSAITGRLSVKGNRITLSDGRFDGPHAAGEFSGAVTIATPMENSGLALILSIRPRPEFFARIRDAYPAAALAAGALENGFSLTIGGTAGNPRVTF